MRVCVCARADEQMPRLVVCRLLVTAESGGWAAMSMSSLVRYAAHRQVCRSVASFSCAMDDSARARRFGRCTANGKTVHERNASSLPSTSVGNSLALVIVDAFDLDEDVMLCSGRERRSSVPCRERCSGLEVGSGMCWLACLAGSGRRCALISLHLSVVCCFAIG